MSTLAPCEWQVDVVNVAWLQAKEARREREAQVAKAQMDSALSRGVSWGFGEDAVVEPEDAGASSVVR